jgi:hypothetical protein
LATPADLVSDACEQLAAYLALLEELVAEPSSPIGGPAGMSPRAADTPEPWNAPAGRALMDGHEGVRRLEAALRYAVTYHPGLRRGGSAGNTAAALAAIPKLAAGLSEDDEAAAARILERWVNQARAVDAIDEAQRWRPLPSRPCPYCGCWFLRVLLDGSGRATGHIECFGHTGTGAACRAVAGVGTDDRGRPVLAWADGLTETPPDLED